MEQEQNQVAQSPAVESPSNINNMTPPFSSDVSQTKANHSWVKIVIPIAVALVLIGGYLAYSANRSHEPADNDTTVENIRDGKTENKTSSAFESSIQTSNDQAKSLAAAERLTCPAIPMPYESYTNPIGRALKITSPNGGENYHLGDTMHISFETCFPIKTLVMEEGDMYFSYFYFFPYDPTSPDVTKDNNTSYAFGGGTPLDPRPYISNFKTSLEGKVYINSFDFKIDAQGNSLKDFNKNRYPLGSKGKLVNTYKLFMEFDHGDHWTSQDLTDNYFTILP